MKTLTQYLNESGEDNLQKSAFKAEWEKMLRIKTPVYEFPNGEYVYIKYNEDKDTLETGYISNSGFKADDESVSVDIDYSRSLDWNLEGLSDVLAETYPEKFSEEE